MISLKKYTTHASIISTFDNRLQGKTTQNQHRTQNQHYVPHAYSWKHLMYACGT